ncbi:putative Saccharopine dehydrogenase NADP binding domain-containing protein [Seiridium cardinale]|uniref:Saccharopine dehydrogenase NADP binding domain-containing protein n=1 Tax=Seiridium cardinale TaxID=138064 RepID=A0ABR2XWK8_9PEZI
MSPPLEQLEASQQSVINDLTQSLSNRTSTQLVDSSLATKSTNMPNIRSFVYLVDNTFPSGNLAALPSDPADEERRASPYHASVAITTAQGTARRGMLHTVNGYTFTSQAAVHASQRVFSGEFKRGFHTSAEVFGVSFITYITGSTIEDAP